MGAWDLWKQLKTNETAPPVLQWASVALFVGILVLMLWYYMFAVPDAADLKLALENTIDDDILSQLERPAGAQSQVSHGGLRKITYTPRLERFGVVQVAAERTSLFSAEGEGTAEVSVPAKDGVLHRLGFRWREENTVEPHSKAFPHRIKQVRKVIVSDLRVLASGEVAR